MPSFPKLVISYAVTAAIFLAALAVLAPHRAAHAGSDDAVAYRTGNR
jgi:hypothetical protein